MENLVVCRFCGAFKSPADIFCDINNIEEEKGSKSITLQEQVSSFFKVKLDKDKSLPQSICTFCRLQVEVCFGYGSNLKKVQQQLESPQYQPLPVDPTIVKREPREHSSLKGKPVLVQLVEMYKKYINNHHENRDFAHITTNIENVLDSGELSPKFIKECKVPTWNDIEFTCQHCNLVTKSLNSFLNHHTKPSAKSTCKRTKIKCPMPECERIFTSLNAFINHTSNTHSLTHLPFTCLVCPKIFYNIASLVRHISQRGHVKIPSIYPCVECGYHAPSMVPLRIHIMTHKIHNIEDGPEDPNSMSSNGETSVPNENSKPGAVRKLKFVE